MIAHKSTFVALCHCCMNVTVQSKHKKSKSKNKKSKNEKKRVGSKMRESSGSEEDS